MKYSGELDVEQPRNRSPGWLMVPLGALLGAATSVILVRANRIRKLSRQSSQESHPDDVGLTSPADLPELPPGNAKVTPQAGGAMPVKLIPASLPSVQAPGGNHWSTPTRYIMGVFLFLAVLVVLYIGRSAIPLVLAAALLALFVDPVIQFFIRRLRMKNGLAVGITYFFVVVVLLLVPLLAIPAILDAAEFVANFDFRLTLEKLSDVIQSTSASLQAYPGFGAILAPVLNSIDTILNNLLSTAQPGDPVIDLTLDELTSRFGQALGIVAGFLGPTISILASIFFTFLLSLQITLTAGELRIWYADLIPPSIGPELSRLIQQVRRAWTGFLRGQMLLMLVIGTITWLGGIALGLPQPLLLGVLAGLMELIPNIGPILAAIPAVLLALIFGSAHFALNNIIFALLVVGFYVLVQLLENQFLVPRIMGDAVDLPTLVVLIGTIAGAGAFGILGALLATPVIATGNLVFRYIYHKIQENPQAEAPPEDRPGLLEGFRSLLSRLRRPARPPKAGEPGASFKP